MRKSTLLAGVFTLGLTLPSAGNAQEQECACVHNETSVKFDLRYRLGEGSPIRADLAPGGDLAMCGPGQSSGPPQQLFVEMDLDMTAGTKMHTYQLDRATSRSTQCSAVPASHHYQVTHEPNNYNHLQLTRGRAAAATAAVAPPAY